MFGNIDLFSIAVFIVCLVISLTIHEFMHAIVGLKLGDTTAHDEGRVSLNPLKHIDPVLTVGLPVLTLMLYQKFFLVAKPVPFNPYNVRYEEFGAAMIAAAGPLSNLALAFVAALIAHALDDSSLMAQIFRLFIDLNVGLFVFNILPIPPLDGSRVFYAFSPEPLQRVLQNIEPIGTFIVVGLAFSSGFGQILTNMTSYILHLLP